MIELVCPVCHQAGGRWPCDFCSRFELELSQNIPDLIPPELATDPVYASELARYKAVADAGPDAYPGYAESHPEFRANLIRDVLVREGVTEFVNVGPGFGALEAVTGDMERLVIDHCLGFLRRLERVHRLRALAERLPLATGGVPCLVADCVFQSIVDREAFLCEAGRVVEPGGLFIFSIATGWNYPRRPQNGFEVTDPGQSTVLWLYLKELGFDVKLSCANLEREQKIANAPGYDYLLYECRKEPADA